MSTFFAVRVVVEEDGRISRFRHRSRSGHSRTCATYAFHGNDPDPPAKDA